MFGAQAVEVRPQEASFCAQGHFSHCVPFGSEDRGRPCHGPGKVVRVIGVISLALSVLRKLALGGELALGGPLRFQPRDRDTESAFLLLVLWTSEWG